MKTYPMTIAGVKRELPICPVNENLSIGAFVIFGDPELTTASADALLKIAPEYDYIITAEAKGIPLAHEMARLAGNQKYFVARKKAKAYMSGVFEVKVNSITTAGEQSLFLDKADAELMCGSRILIVDDVISTGESLRAVEELVEAAGGKIIGKMTILAEGDAQTRDDIIYLEKLPLFNPDGSVIEDTLH
ncbi:MAG: adenine phosphoribosyltransferase [Ruminococcaceae bacterium]|nr:adenine phosphoribosyltransferase [Oscillospiraceae bacterium]